MEVVSSGEPEADEMLTRLAGEGLPGSLLDLGFKDISEFWAPWCVISKDGEISSIAFAARLSSSGCELGVATAPRFRGRGHAGAVTAEWTNYPSLGSRELFYSTHRTNTASQRVAEKLGLRRVGASLRIS